MTPKKTSAAPPLPAITLEDIYYILFRHKWLIITLSVMALVTAAAVHTTWPVTYESEAELEIKYVHDDRLPTQIGQNTPQLSMDTRGDQAMNSEILILQSMDVITNVVQNIGPARILAKAGGGTNFYLAAGLVRRGLQAIPTKSDIVQIVFSHPDPEMVQPILAQIIDCYLKKHDEVHHLALNDTYIKSRDDANGHVISIAQDLHDVEAKNGILMEGKTEESYNDQLNQATTQVMADNVQYAGYEQTIRELKAMYEPKTVPAPVKTNAPAAPAPSTAEPPSDTVSEYQTVGQRLKRLQAEGEKLSVEYTATSTFVLTNKALIAVARKEKADLEKQYPSLATVKIPETATSPTAPASVTQGEDPKLMLRDTIVKADALAAEIQMLTNQIAMLQTKTFAMSSVKGKIDQLKRDRDSAINEAAFFDRMLDQTVLQQNGAGNSNIGSVEAPTPAIRNISQVTKISLIILFGGLFLAFALPFVIELVLDRTLKRPADVQNRLRLPFFITIPQVKLNGKRRALKTSKVKALLPQPAPIPATEAAMDGITPPVLADQGPTMDHNGRLQPWEGSFVLQPYYETLRDRLMTYFEMINLTHKPKLVAVTSCAAGAGVTTTAAGLASSLSETGDGNVLLVNMNVRDGEAHHFYKGKLACNLDEVLEKGSAGSSPIQGSNLYMAAEETEDDRLPRVLPKRFNHLLPKMKASDFDYIIFDMPPVTQISITPRLARFMDMVLLVVESGKTNRDVAKHTAEMLSETKTNVGIVLNKNQTYLPRRMRPDL